MRREDAVVPAIEVLRHQLSRLGTASPRSNTSLDCDTVLPGVRDAAWPLTSARDGLSTRVDHVARLRGSLFSSIRTREARLVHELTDGGATLRVREAARGNRCVCLPDRPERRPPVAVVRSGLSPRRA